MLNKVRISGIPFFLPIFQLALFFRRILQLRSDSRDYAVNRTWNNILQNRGEHGLDMAIGTG